MRFALLSAAAVLLLLSGVGPGAAQDRRGPPRAEFFSEPNFQGERRELTGEVRDFERLGFNDRALSVRVTGAWEFCEDSSFNDRCITLTRDAPDLRSLGMAQRISSARPVTDGPAGRAPRAGLTLFEGLSGGGRALDVRGETGSLAALGFNDRARSLQADGRWVVCEHAEFGGLCARVEGRVDDLTTLGLSGRISSAYPDDGRGGFAPRPGPEPDRFSGGGFGAGRSLEGRSAAFFPSPTDRGGPMSACPEGGVSNACAQRTADDFCYAQGFRRAAYFNIAGRRFPTLEDVLCQR